MEKMTEKKEIKRQQERRKRWKRKISQDIFFGIFSKTDARAHSELRTTILNTDVVFFFLSYACTARFLNVRHSWKLRKLGCYLVMIVFVKWIMILVHKMQFKRVNRGLCFFPKVTILKCLWFFYTFVLLLQLKGFLEIACGIWTISVSKLAVNKTQSSNLLVNCFIRFFVAFVNLLCLRSQFTGYWNNHV